MSRTLARRLAKLEGLRKPSDPLRLIVRYEGCNWNDPEDELQEDVDENDPNTMVLTVQYVDMPRVEDR
jgi:hypothetical protein